MSNHRQIPTVFSQHSYRPSVAIIEDFLLGNFSFLFLWSQYSNLKARFCSQFFTPERMIHTQTRCYAAWQCTSPQKRLRIYISLSHWLWVWPDDLLPYELFHSQGGSGCDRNRGCSPWEGLSAGRGCSFNLLLEWETRGTDLNPTPRLTQSCPSRPPGLWTINK